MFHKWPDKRQFYYDSDQGRLYLETVFGIASFITTPAAILANIDDPYTIFFYFAIAFGVLGIIIAIAHIVSAVRYGSSKGMTFTGFGLAGSILGIGIAVLALMKFVW